MAMNKKEFDEILYDYSKKINIFERINKEAYLLDMKYIFTFKEYSIDDFLYTQENKSLFEIVQKINDKEKSIGFYIRVDCLEDNVNKFELIARTEEHKETIIVLSSDEIKEMFNHD